MAWLYEAGVAFDLPSEAWDHLGLTESGVWTAVIAVCSNMSCTFYEPDLSTERRQTFLCNAIASETSPFINLMSDSHMMKCWAPLSQESARYLYIYLRDWHICTSDGLITSLLEASAVVVATCGTCGLLVVRIAWISNCMVCWQRYPGFVHINVWLSLPPVTGFQPIPCSPCESLQQLDLMNLMLHLILTIDNCCNLQTCMVVLSSQHQSAASG